MQHGSDQGAADILIPVRNRFAETRRLLESIYRYTDHPFHIYIIDNASTDETVDLDKIYARSITVIRNRQNRGWCGAIRQGIQLACNPYLVFMNTDVELAQGWLGNMIAFLKTHPRIAAVAPLSSNSQDTLGVDRVRDQLVREIPRFFTEDIHDRNRILQYHFQHTGVLVEGILPFYCTVLSRRAVQRVGPPRDSNAGGDDADYCRRLRSAGYVLGLALGAYVVRHPTAPQTRAYGSSPRQARKSRRSR